MFKKINKFLDTPITWRASTKAGLYVMISEIIVFGGYHIYKKLEYKKLAKAGHNACENIKKDIKEKWETTTEDDEG